MTMVRTIVFLMTIITDHSLSYDYYYGHSLSYDYGYGHSLSDDYGKRLSYDYY